MVKFNAPQLRPGLYAADVLTTSRTDIKTYFVRLQFDGGKVPAELIDALARIGFKPNAQKNALPISADILCVVDYRRRGSGLFGAWTSDESLEVMPRLEEVFTQFGLPFTPRQATPFEAI